MDKALMDKALLLKLYELNGLVMSLETLQGVNQKHFANPMIVKVADAMQEIMEIVKEDQRHAAIRPAADQRRQTAVRHIG